MSGPPPHYLLLGFHQAETGSQESLEDQQWYSWEYINLKSRDFLTAALSEQVRHSVGFLTNKVQQQLILSALSSPRVTKVEKIRTKRSVFWWDVPQGKKMTQPSGVFYWFVSEAKRKEHILYHCINPQGRGRVEKMSLISAPMVCIKHQTNAAAQLPQASDKN